MKPGNAGGAKGPYFGDVSEEEKEEVIDDKSDTPRKIRELQKRLYEKAKQVSHQSALREPVAKSVGKPDAGNRHVRFDERGRETTGCLLAPVQRPSSTLPNPNSEHTPNSDPEL